MFILAFIAELIVNANWAAIPHWAFIITGILAALELLVYLVSFAVSGGIIFKAFKDWRD
jgi:hypothetical protein